MSESNGVTMLALRDEGTRVATLVGKFRFTLLTQLATADNL